MKMPRRDLQGLDRGGSFGPMVDESGMSRRISRIKRTYIFGLPAYGKR
jgi:hypothetical protein